MNIKELMEEKKSKVIAEEHGDEINPEMDPSEMFKTLAAYSGNVDVIEGAIKIVQASWLDLGWILEGSWKDLEEADEAYPPVVGWEEPEDRKDFEDEDSPFDTEGDDK